ncbi:family 75 glycoside hydrolase [Echria macrotheca]|uniref:Endo-chitosanase n=1 Tax=Echria macrotheca TaxID=438768 RepID=A0AAJ0BNK3_9PEZI|nr:family 75 glycoside hydrolase [Echria macrotheca]
MEISVLFVFLFISCAATARQVPQNLRNFYNTLTTCSNKLASGFWSTDGGSPSFSYCGDHLADDGIVYIKANMDIDCDGAQGGSADDGRCGASTDTQSITAFQQTVRQYGKGIRDLNANVHPYVVFGNTGSKPGWESFDPQQYGIEPLSVMAVVCGDQLVYGVWGDTNGDDGDHPVVGEASISLATACFGKTVNGNSGHDQNDVLYIAFAGSKAVPGADGANWAARNCADFQKSIESLGDSLVAQIEGGDGSGGDGEVDGNCEWPGHCAGAACSSNDDCSDVLACVNRVCAMG